MGVSAADGFAVARPVRPTPRPARAPHLVAILASFALAAGCGSASSSGFDRAASDAASTVFAASTTLQFVHGGKATVAFGSGAFVEYAGGLEGVADELPSLDGAPPPSEAQRLAAMLRAATAVVRDPCLGDGCAWEPQRRLLDATGQALLEARGGSGG